MYNAVEDKMENDLWNGEDDVSRFTKMSSYLIASAINEIYCNVVPITFS